MAKTAAEKRKQEAAYAWHAAQLAKRSGTKSKSTPVKTTGTAYQSRMQKSEGLRQKFTPSGLQSFIDVMSKKTKKEKK